MSSPPIALVGIASELARLTARLSVEDSQQHPWGRLLLCRWPGVSAPLVLGEVAVGKVGAAMGVQGLIQAARPGVVLNCGSAGALSSDLKVGDLVLGNPVIAHDQGIYLPLGEAQPGLPGDGFVHAGSPMPIGRRRSFPADPLLLEKAQDAAARTAGMRSQVGAIVTGDQVIFQDERKRWLRQSFGALAVENEGAAVAQVAHCYGLPWLVIRGISDGADGQASFDFTPLLAFQDDGPSPGRVFRWARALRHEASQPGTLRRLRRFRRGVDRAMSQIALLLDAFLPTL